MENSFGKAVKKAISHEEKIERTDARHQRISLFANPTRQKIFMYVCKKPCSHLRLIARDLNMAAPTAEWHLKKFIEHRILREAAVGNKRVYYPSNMIDVKDVGLISILNSEKARNIYRMIISSPGLPQKEICEKLNSYQQMVSSHTNQLEEAGLIVSVKEGRYKKYHIKMHPEDILKAYAKRSKHFRDWIIEVLKEEGLKPKTLSVRDMELKVQIQSHGRTRVLKINTNPLSSI